MVNLQVVNDEVLLRQLDFQELEVVEQLFSLEDLFSDFLRFVLLVGGRDVLCGHRRLQAEVFRLQRTGNVHGRVLVLFRWHILLQCECLPDINELVQLRIGLPLLSTSVGGSTNVFYANVNRN